MGSIHPVVLIGCGVERRRGVSGCVDKVCR